MNYVAFDIGNVLCTIDFSEFISKLSSILNIRETEIKPRLDKYHKLCDVGLMSMQTILEIEFGIKSQSLIDDLLQFWNCVICFQNQTYNFLWELEKEGTKIALLSNIGVDHAKCINGLKFIIPPNVIKFFSCDVGVRKPSILYYQSFLMQYPEFKGCVYVDDIEENLHMGKLLGFNTYKLDLASFNNISIENSLNKIKNMIYCDI